VRPLAWCSRPRTSTALLEGAQTATPPDLYDLVFGSKDYAAEAERIHEIVQQRVPGAASLLDVACGTGRHLEHLRRWYAVEGLDLDPAMLEHARSRLPDVLLHEGDMREFALGREFDAVTCLFSAIALVRTVDGLRQAVATMGSHLRSGGVLIVEPWDSPEEHPAEGKPWVEVVEEPARIAVVMETSALAGSVWNEDSHYLVWTPEGIEHVHEEGESGAFTSEDHLAAFRATGLEVEHDPVGLIGRGLYIGVRARTGSRDEAPQSL
jgi:SAM-dependent methyltransferase